MRKSVTHNTSHRNGVHRSEARVNVVSSISQALVLPTDGCAKELQQLCSIAQNINRTCVNGKGDEITFTMLCIAEFAYAHHQRLGYLTWLTIHTSRTVDTNYNRAFWYSLLMRKTTRRTQHPALIVENLQTSSHILCQEYVLHVDI